MPRFKHYNYDQDSMVVINYQEQLQPGTFEHAVHYLIEHKLDLSVFHPKYRNDDTGRLAYDPAILLKIILFAYSKGTAVFNPVVQMTAFKQPVYCAQFPVFCQD